MTRIYIAGRIERSRDRFGLPIDITTSPDDGTDARGYLDQQPIPFMFEGRSYTYTGPFTVGCDHSCAHAYDHAVGPTCGQEAFYSFSGEEMVDDLRDSVFDKSLDQISSADVVFAWLGDDSHEAHGTLVEIGYAKGLGKLVLIGHKPEDSAETWFAKRAGKSFIAESGREAFSAAMNWYFATDYRFRNSTKDFFDRLAERRRNVNSAKQAA